MRFLIFSLVFLMLGIVFFVFSIMFGKTSLLFLMPLHSILCVSIMFLLTHCLVPHSVMRTAIRLFVANFVLQ